MASILHVVLDDVKRLPLWHVRWQHYRDDRLWVREDNRVKFYKLTCSYCPCTKCKGRFLYIVGHMREHLIHNGNDPRFRVWRSLGSRDSSDEEWEEDFRRPVGQQTQKLIMELICKL